MEPNENLNELTITFHDVMLCLFEQGYIAYDSNINSIFMELRKKGEPKHKIILIMDKGEEHV